MRTFLLSILVIGIAGCSTEPRSLKFGEDACYVCKMTLVDNKFGAELVTQKGKVYVFDDLNCMLSFYHSGYEPTDKLAHILVVDYHQPGQLIDAQHALYVKSNLVRSPMASGIAAFAGERSYQPYLNDWKGILMSWGEVLTQFK